MCGYTEAQFSSLIFIMVHCGPLRPLAQAVHRKYPGPITDPMIAPCGVLGSVVDVFPCSQLGWCAASSTASGQQVFLIERRQHNEVTWHIMMGRNASTQGGLFIFPCGGQQGGCKPAWEQCRGGNVNLYDLWITDVSNIRVLIDRKLLPYRQEAALPGSYGQETYQSVCGGCGENTAS